MNLLKSTARHLFSPKSLKEIVYLLLAMPLGIAYFVLLTVGMSLGAGLLVLGIGLFILMGVLVLSRLGGFFESILARYLLDADVDLSIGFHYDRYMSVFDNARQILLSGGVLRSLAFLALKFPLGIATFTLTIVSIALPLGLISAPFTYDATRMTIGNRVIDTPIEAVMAMLLGVMLLPLSFAILKSMSRGWRSLAENLLAPRTMEKQKRKHDFSHLEEEQLHYYYDERPTDDEDEVKSLRQILSSS